MNREDFKEAYREALTQEFEPPADAEPHVFSGRVLRAVEEADAGRKSRKLPAFMPVRGLAAGLACVLVLAAAVMLGNSFFMRTETNSLAKEKEFYVAELSQKIGPVWDKTEPKLDAYVFGADLMEAYDSLRKVTAAKPEFSKIFGGVYEENGRAIILVTEENAEFSAFVATLLSPERYEIRVVDYSYQDLMLVVSSLNHWVGTASVMRKAGTASEEQLDLMQYWPCVGLAEVQNRVIVSLAISEEDAEEIGLIERFEAAAGKHDCVVFTFDPDYKPANYYSADNYGVSRFAFGVIPF